MKDYLLLIKREVYCAWRAPADFLQPLIFFALIGLLFPLAVEPNPELLGRAAPGIIWIGALLAHLLGLELVIKHDYQDGSLDQLYLRPVSLEVMLLAKTSSHWLLCSLPILLLSPLLGYAFHLSLGELGLLMASLALGTAILSLLGILIAIITLRCRQVMAAILLLPLYTPVVIVSAGCVHSVLPQTLLLLLLAALVFCVSILPWLMASLLQEVME